MKAYLAHSFSINKHDKPYLFFIIQTINKRLDFGLVSNVPINIIDIFVYSFYLPQIEIHNNDYIIHELYNLYIVS